MEFRLFVTKAHGMSLIEQTHREDIKAVIRKRYGSLAAFERTKKLARQSVTEVLRGRPSAKTRSAIERVLKQERRESIIPVGSEPQPSPQHLNAGAR